MSFELEQQSYDIESELRVRKILEQKTDWQFEFTKNSKYAPDLQLHDWGDHPDSPEDRDLTGYIEIEVTNAESDWQTGSIPESWTTINFLKRKVREFDYHTQRWGELKKTARQTVYLKFNHGLDNCFAAPVERVYYDGHEQSWNGGGPQWEFFCLSPGHDSITYGIHDSVRFIEDYFDRLEDNQSSLSHFNQQRGESDD